MPSLIARNLAASGYAKREVGSSMRLGFIELDAAGLVAKNDPLTKLKVRRGIYYAIDRPAIVKNLVGKGAKIIDEGLVQRPLDIDVIWIYGYGFPSYRGGPMFYADASGREHVLETMTRLHDTHGEELAPAPLLARLVGDSQSFANL